MLMSVMKRKASGIHCLSSKILGMEKVHFFELEISDDDNFNIILITDNMLQLNIYDYAKFFYPNVHTCSMTSTGDIPAVDWDKRTFVS